MAALPYMQLYVADYLADTAHLTTEEHGAYLLLLFSYWQTGKPLRIDRLATVARLSNERWNEIKDTLEEFFHVEGNTWQHFRVDADLESVNDKQRQKSKAGKASARKKAEEKKQLLKDKAAGVEQPLQQKLNYTDTDTNPEEDTDSTLPPDIQFMQEIRAHFEKRLADRFDEEYIKEEAATFYHHYNSLGWEVNGKPVDSWESLADKWIIKIKK